ncbi:zinc finger protein 227 [Chanos chanos]|uniref:Zinc finger protein 227 n=1 Tax=Chanos chanos TaxID=29144 RepID=A0A6J2W659_CHACN|nr:zinc finger protein 227-like [Chanos chanos]
MNSQHCTNSQLNPGADSTPALSSTRQKRGRPQKKELVSPDLKTVGTMKEIDHYSFPTEANGPASSTYTTTAKTASVPAVVALRRPCKIDRRRKRFRKMKAMEMERLTEKEKVSSLCQDPLSGVGHISTNSTLVKFEPDHNAEKATSLIQQVSTSRKTTYGNRKRHKIKRSVWNRKRIVQDTQLKVHQDTAVKQMCENKESVNNSKDFPVEKERASAESMDTYEHDSLSPQKTQSMLPVHVLQTRTMKVEFTDGNPPCDDISVENEKLLHNVTVNLQPEYCRDDQLAKTNVDQDVQVKLKEMPCILNIKSSKRMKEEGVFLQNTLTDFSKAVKETGETTSKDSCCKPLNNEDKQEHVVVVGQRNQYLKLKDSHSSDISSDEVLAENSNGDCNGSLSRGRPRKEKKPIKCEYCDRLFNHLSPYIIHRRIHTGEKPFSCQECGRSFAQLSNLRSHYKVHKGSSKQHFRYSNKSNKFPLQRDNQRQSKLHATGSSKQLRTVENFDSDCFVTPDNTSPKKGKVQVCPYCGKAFRFRSVLNIHLRVHSGEKPYLCRVCGKGFTQACSVRIHERIHWSVKPFLCSKCGKGFSQIGTLKGHTCHGNKQIHSTLKDMEVSGAVTFRCHLCKECFDHRHAYELHLQTHTDIQRYTCDVCGEKYSLLSELNAHQNFCLNMKILDTKPDHSEPVVKPQVNSQHLQHTQSICAAVKLETPQPKKHSNQFLTPLSLRSHSIQPQRHKKYLSLLSCPIKKMVTSVYDSQYNFKHQPFKNGRFVSQLNSVDQKSDPRKYFCPRCGRLFRHVGRLRAHMLTHARGQSYTCGCCGKTLENWSKFWRHQRIHRQKHGRFFCPTCGQGFRFVGVYEKHLQEHPELNAYFCPICPHTFSSAKRLRDHQVEWHGACMPYICDICGKGFRSPVILERHKVAHRQILSQMDNFCEVEVRPSAVPYQCGKCDSSFKTLDLLFHHQILHPCRSRQSDGSNHCTRNQDLHQAAHSSASTCEPTGYNPQCVKDCPSTLPSDRTNNKPLKVRSQSKHANLPHHLLLSETVFLHPMHRQKNLSAQNTIDADTPLWSDAHFDPHSQSKEAQDVNKLQCTGSAVHTNYQVSVEPSPRDLSAVTDKMEERTEVVGCTECNATFTAIPLLFQHYLQHAREEV